MIGRIPSRIQSVPARVAIDSEPFRQHCTNFHFVEPMAKTTRVLRSYDHRLRELVHTTGDSSLALVKPNCLEFRADIGFSSEKADFDPHSKRTSTRQIAQKCQLLGSSLR